MDHIAQHELDERDAAVAAIHTVAEAEQRQKIVREKILAAMGGLPDYKGPLNARVTGHIQADGYVIEKVIFESLPHFYVTADLYRPTQPGRYPGVLLQSGHIQEGKPESQRVAANLALKGFVVFAFDPIGQGEREQTYSALQGGPLAGGATNEHLQLEAQGLLIGQGVARYFIWDAMRALDYMQSRPEVDGTRMGAVGCSGGGATTTWIGALDPRIKAVASACSTNTYRLMFARPVPHGEMHAEMGLHRMLAERLDTADLVEARAPTPWMIMATQGDYFTPDAAELVYKDAQRWYGLYGAENKLSFFVGPGPHGMPLETREHIYEWMIRWLKDGKGDPHELPVHQYRNFELLVTRTGRVADLPGSRKLYQIIHDDWRAKMKQGTTAQLVAELTKLGVPTGGAAPDVKVLDESAGEGYRAQHIRFESEPGVEIEGKLYIPAAPVNRQAVLVVSDTMRSPWIPSTDSIAERIAKAGRVVLTLEVRDDPSGFDRRVNLGNWMANTRADHIGLNLPAMRAHDILRGVDVLAARRDVDPSAIHATARSVKGMWLLMAAAVDPRISKVWLDRTPYSIRAALNTSLNSGLFDGMIPGFALHWDIDDLRKAMGKRPVLWTDPTNWMNRLVSLPAPFEYRYVFGDTTDL
jgi:cephalosporin-C deacetylase-like acetyl esterase